jgi:hypothetical protein
MEKAMVKNILILFFLVFSLSCSNQENKAKRILGDYLNAKLSGNIEKAHKLLFEEDKEAILYSSYKLEYGLPDNLIINNLKSNFQFSIDSLELTQDTVIALVSIEIPDYFQNMRMIGAMLISTTEIKDEESAEKIVTEFFTNEYISKVKETKLFVLINETSEWKVFENYKKKLLVDSLLTEAENYLRKRSIMVLKTCMKEF